MTLHNFLRTNNIYLSIIIIFLCLPVYNEHLYAQTKNSKQSSYVEIKVEEENNNVDTANKNTIDSDSEDIYDTEYDGQEPEFAEESNGTISRTHRFFSESVLGVTNSLDTFWGDDRSLEEANRSRIWVRFDFDIEQNSGFDFIPTVRANIRIPRTRDRLHLFFNGEEGDEDELETDIKDNDEAGTLFLRYFLFNSPWQSLGLDTGVRIRSSGIEWFAGLRARVYRTFGDWGFRVTDRLRWFTDSKFTNETRLDVERVVFKTKSFFRSSTFGRWFERKEGYFVEQNFQLFHKLAQRKGIVLQWRTLGETQVDEFFKETRVRLRYRQTIHWKWLFGEIAPSIFWKKKYDWDTNFGIRFRLEVHFGNLSDLRIF